MDDVLKFQIPDSVDSGVYLKDELPGVEGILEGYGSIDSDDPKPAAADSETVSRLFSLFQFVLFPSLF